jgi:two-component system, NtrC family, response regulator AtoC
VPPLRSRPTEVRALAHLFLKQACESLGREPPAIDQAALEKLYAHPWPGNIRELKNLVSCLAATVEGPVIRACDLTFPSLPLAAAAGAPSEPAPGIRPRAFRPLAEAVLDFERQYIHEALAATGGHKTRAAKLLDVPLRTFMTKVRRHSSARAPRASR